MTAHQAKLREHREVEHGDADIELVAPRELDLAVIGAVSSNTDSDPAEVRVRLHMHIIRNERI